jgi:antirestriction protein ArdC
VASEDKPDIYQRVTDKILQAMAAGPGEWRMPWQVTASNAIPVNAVSQQMYRGVNVLVLWVTAQEQKYESNLWATYKQWRDLGAQVKKGERAAPVVFWKVTDKEVAAEHEENAETKRLFLARGYSVFNVSQVEGYTATQETKVSHDERIETAERFFFGLGADIRHGGGRAFYRVEDDFIRIPELHTFRTSIDYYSILAHELTHWSGAEKRLNRDLSNRFGSEAYAAEELVAELGAAFSMARLGLSSEPRPDHAAYIAGWHTLLQNDKRAIFTAAAKAQQAVDYLHEEHDPVYTYCDMELVALQNWVKAEWNAHPEEHKIHDASSNQGLQPMSDNQGAPVKDPGLELDPPQTQGREIAEERVKTPGPEPTTSDETREPATEAREEPSMSDPTAFLRRERLAQISAEPGTREALEARHGQVLDSRQLADQYEALGFLAPYVVVRRKSDGLRGSLEFQHDPRFYFNWHPDTPAHAATPTPLERDREDQERNDSMNQYERNYQRLTELLPEGRDHIRIDNNEPYLPLVVGKHGANLITLARCEDRNGNENTTLVFRVEGNEATPIFFGRDYSRSDFAEGVALQPEQQKDLNNRADMWWQDLHQMGYFQKAQDKRQEGRQLETKAVTPAKEPGPELDPPHTQGGEQPHLDETQPSEGEELGSQVVGPSLLPALEKPVQEHIKNNTPTLTNDTGGEPIAEKTLYLAKINPLRSLEGVRAMEAKDQGEAIALVEEEFERAWGDVSTCVDQKTTVLAIDGVPVEAETQVGLVPETHHPPETKKERTDEVQQEGTNDHRGPKDQEKDRLNSYVVQAEETWRFTQQLNVEATSREEAEELAQAEFEEAGITWDDGTRLEIDAIALTENGQPLPLPHQAQSLAVEEQTSEAAQGPGSEQQNLQSPSLTDQELHEMRPAAERAGIACTIALVGYTAAKPLYETVVKPVYENRKAAFQELFVGEQAPSQTFYINQGEDMFRKKVEAQEPQQEKTTTNALTPAQEHILSLIGGSDGLRELVRDQLRDLNEEKAAKSSETTTPEAVVAPEGLTTTKNERSAAMQERGNGEQSGAREGSSHNKPVKLECGVLRAFLWDNGPDREPTATFNRIYKHNDEWKYSQSFRPKDLGDLAKLVRDVEQNIEHAKAKEGNRPADNKELKRGNDQERDR